MTTPEHPVPVEEQYNDLRRSYTCAEIDPFAYIADLALLYARKLDERVSGMGQANVGHRDIYQSAVACLADQAVVLDKQKIIVPELTASPLPQFTRLRRRGYRRITEQYGDTFVLEGEFPDKPFGYKLRIDSSEKRMNEKDMQIDSRIQAAVLLDIRAWDLINRVTDWFEKRLDPKVACQIAVEKAEEYWGEVAKETAFVAQYGRAAFAAVEATYQELFGDNAEDVLLLIRAVMSRGDNTEYREPIRWRVLKMINNGDIEGAKAAVARDVKEHGRLYSTRIKVQLKS